eukprot:TRINITY_DN2515_c0_g1_i2.p1 TRINITY_DN2515_c0_g1~~TRINITY_DN2515_c0_g1_i2.p1  ORF type:complete len:228 (-),score=53.90 TRINITY_DN2515_c0_g1_i2:161-844(-)
MKIQQRKYEAALDNIQRETNTFDFETLNNDEFILLDIKESLEKSIDEYTQAISEIQSHKKRESVLLKRERKIYQELRDINNNLKERINKQEEQMTISHASLTKSYTEKLIEKREKLKESNDTIKEKMNWFFDKYFYTFELGSSESNKGQQKITEYLSLDNYNKENEKNFISIHELVDILINNALQENDYIPIESEYWPPHLQLLQLVGVCEYNPKDSNYFRLINVHQ